jgi:hypothetical protein
MKTFKTDDETGDVIEALAKAYHMPRAWMINIMAFDFVSARYAELKRKIQTNQNLINRFAEQSRQTGEDLCEYMLQLENYINEDNEMLIALSPAIARVNSCPSVMDRIAQEREKQKV